MKDMFDCFEETYNENEPKKVYLIQVRKNKRKQTKRYFYLSYIDDTGKTEWTVNKEDSILLMYNQIFTSYPYVRDLIRKYRIECELYIEPLIKPKSQPVRKRWWVELKVWLSRKIQYFAGWIPLER